jgi:peptidoglycan/xylan/chitin deacetylase (PgdA/CDA1 family)
MLPLVAIAGLLGAALLAWLRIWRIESRPDRIVALLYHRLVSPQEFESFPPLARNFAIPAERFRAQLRLLKQTGYTPVTMDAVVDAIEQGAPLPPRPVLVTFDDGCESVHRLALPILREEGVPALLFVTTDPGAWIFHGTPDAQRRLSDDEIRELDRDGVAIGSHAHSHEPLQPMSQAEIEHELGLSKRYLERVIGKPVPYFGVPLNWYGSKVREAAVKLGYRAVCTSDTGAIQRDSDLFHLRRMNVEGWMSPADLADQIQPAAIVQRRVIAFFKRAPARLVGPAIWLPFRRWLFASPLGRFLSLRSLRRLLVAGTLGVVALALLLGVLLAD